MFYSTRADEADRIPAERAERTLSDAPFLDPVRLARAAWNARLLVLAGALAGGVLAGAVALSQPQQYSATAQLVIDPRDLNLVQNEVTVTPTGLTNDATLALIESQIAVMTSHAVLGRVVDEAVLTADPEFNGTRRSLLSGVAGLFSLFSASDPDAAIRNREQVTIENFGRRLSAVRGANSFVIQLTVRSEDPAKAARLANLTTEAFIAEQGRAQGEVARRATAALSSRLAELRERVTLAEDAVERYKAENQLVGVGGRLIGDDYLTRINSELANASAQVTALNVRAQSLREASVDDVVEGSFPEGLNAESLLRLRQTYSEAAQNAAVVSSRLGPRHPTRIAAEEAVATARRAIQGELARIVASAQTELARARQTEDDLAAQIETLRTRQLETSGSFVRLRELEREVDASRAVYEAFLLRARQTGEQESLNTSNVRVISDAIAPLHPSGTSRKLIALAGAILGFGLVLGGVLLRSILREGTERSAASLAAHRAFAPALRAPLSGTDALSSARAAAAPPAAPAGRAAHTPFPHDDAAHEGDILARRDVLRDKIREIGRRRATLADAPAGPERVDAEPSHETAAAEPEPAAEARPLPAGSTAVQDPSEPPAPQAEDGAAREAEAEQARQRISLHLEAVRRRRLQAVSRSTS